MKFCHLTIFIFVFLGCVSSISAQNLIAEQQQFDSLFRAGRYQASVTPGKKLFGEFEHLELSDSFKMRILKRLTFAFYLSAEADLFDKAAARFLTTVQPISQHRADILVLYGGAQTDRGNLALADSLIREAIQEHTTAGIEVEKNIAYDRYLLARNLMNQSKYDEAEQILNACIQFYKTAPTDDKLGGCCQLLTNVYYYQGQISKALEINALTMEAWRNFPMHLPKSRLLRVNLLLAGEHFAEADSLLSLALEEVGRQPETERTLLIYLGNTKGNLAFSLKQYESSIEILNDVFDRQIKSTGNYTDEKLIQNRVNVATAMYHLGNKKEAFQLLNGVLDSIKSARVENTRLLGYTTCSLALLTEDKPTALRLMEEGLGTLNKNGIGTDDRSYDTYVAQLANMYLALDSVNAAERTLAKMSKHGDLSNLQSDLQYRVQGSIDAKKNDWEKAVQNWNLLTRFSESKLADKLFFLNDFQRLNAVEQLQEESSFLLSQTMMPAAQNAGLIPVALNRQIFIKSLLLSAAQHIRQNIQRDSGLAPVFAAWRDVREKLAWCYTQPKTALESLKLNIPALELRADSLEKEIARHSKDFASAGLRESFTWQDVQQKLQPGEMAIEIARFRDDQQEPGDSVRYAVFIIKPGNAQPQVVFLHDGDRLEQIVVEQYLNECANPAGRGQTGELYRAFWAQIEPFLTGVSRIYVDADGAFFKINPGAILLPDGRFVADQYEIRHVFSLKDIQKQNDPHLSDNTSVKTAFLVGNPAFLLQSENETASTMRSVTTSRDAVPATDPFANILREVHESRGLILAPLPGSEDEVNDIAAKMNKKGWQTTVATGSKAQKTAVITQKSPTVLHLATHGYFLANVRSGTAGFSRPVLESNPMMRSMLFLSGAQNTLNKKTLGNDDGILTAYEAQNLSLEGTELVVLSACQTAQGKIQNGEGVYGLQRAFRIAGAQSVILSLWDVDDKAGREFMVVFYEKWLGGMSKSEAFSAARKVIKKKYPQPFYWAGFVLME